MQDAIQTAYNKFNIGDFESAMALCLDILAEIPDQPKALSLLGLIHHQKGELIKAAGYLKRVIAGAPFDPLTSYNYGVILSQLDHTQEALAVFNEVLSRHRAFPEAHFMLGNIYYGQQQYAQAADHYQQATGLNPQYHDAWFNLGIAHKQLLQYDLAAGAFRQALNALPDHVPSLFQMGLVLQAQERTEEAIVAFRRVLALTPEDPLICQNLGILLRDSGQVDDAITSLEKANVLKPFNAQILNELGLAFHDARAFDKAIAAFCQAIGLMSDYPAALSNLGNALLETDRLEEAIGRYEQAIALDPQFHEAWYNLGTCYHQTMADPGRAIPLYRKAISLKPDMVEAHWNLSHALLLKGHFEEGFEEYLWRWRRKSAVNPAIPKPEWHCGMPPDQTLLVHTEQGMGDAIQFVRYLPIVKERVGRIFLACEASLIALFQSLSGIDAIFEKKNLSSLSQAIDCHVPLLNLPSILATTETTIPASVPYLQPDRQRLAKHAPLFAEARSLFKVGLVWQGNPKHKNDANRSCRLADFAPLFRLPGLAFFSLQKDPTLGSDPPFPGIDLAKHMENFADTAAFVSHLDLVISVDTAVAHLAGALGKPIWVLLPFVPDWRWMLDREDSPWYPTMRLFRQKQRRDWRPVIQEVANALVREMDGSK